MKKGLYVLLTAAVLLITGCTKPYNGQYTYTAIILGDYEIVNEYAIAFPKNSPLKDPFDAIIEKMKADGTLACLNVHYETDGDDCYESIDFTNKIYDDIDHDGGGATLKVMTSSGYPPFEYLDDEGNLAGYDIDLATFIAKELNYQLEWVDGAFESIIVHLNQERVDFAIAAITPSPDRAEAVDFSTVYYEGAEIVLLFKETDRYTSLSDLKNLTIAAQNGTIQAEIIENMAKDKAIKKAYFVDYPANAMEALRKHKIDAILIEKSVADKLLETYNNTN